MPQHPYLFFAKKDIPALHARFAKEPFATRWHLLLSDAEEILLVSPCGQTDDRLSYRYALTTAFAYVITGEKRFADRAIQEVLNDFTLDRAERWQFNSVNCTGAGLGTSNFSLSVGVVYDWCYDAMTEDVRNQFRQGFETLVNDLYLKSLNHPDNPEEHDWWVYNNHSNWSSVCHAAQGVAALAFYDESIKARRAAHHAERHIERFFPDNIGIDGGCAEGVMYARYGIEYALYFFTASCRFFGLNRARRDTMKLISDRLTGYWDMYMLAPDLSYANFGNIDEEVMRAFWTPDGRRKPETLENEGPNGTVCAFLDAILPDGDPLLRWGADVGGTWYIWEGACPFHLLWRKDEKPPTTKFPVALQDAVFFRETGQAVIRTEKLWLAFNGGLVSPDSHFNRDLGSFILLYDGIRFVNDPGYGDSDTSSHSTILVNGLGQIRNGYGQFLCFDKGEDFYALSCDLTHAYDPRAGLDRFIRHMLVIRGKYVLVLDELEADNDAAFEWRLQTRHDVGALDGGAGMCIEAQGKQMTVRMARTEQDAAWTVCPWKRIQRRTDTTIRALCAQPPQKTRAHSFAAVLCPVEAQETLPEVSYQREGCTVSVIVAFADGATDHIVFTRETRALRLQTVNGKILSGKLNPHHRSVIPFRDTAKHEADEAAMPPWLLGTYQDYSNL